MIPTSHRCFMLALLVASSLHAVAQRPSRTLDIAGVLVPFDSLVERGVVLLNSANVNYPLSRPLAADLLDRGIPVFLDPARAIATTQVQTVADENSPRWTPTVASDLGYRVDARAYGLMLEYECRFPSGLARDCYTSAMILDRTTGQVLRMVTSEGSYDEDDVKDFVAALFYAPTRPTRSGD